MHHPVLVSIRWYYHLLMTCSAINEFSGKLTDLRGWCSLILIPVLRPQQTTSGLNVLYFSRDEQALTQPTLITTLAIQ
uniref:Putative secreted protein n=1 Tax=Panstrongylus lignarius TaxID=156445 RepID=A0A224Y055_9HEMI